jgi:hypothetical protein
MQPTAQIKRGRNPLAWSTVDQWTWSTAQIAPSPVHPEAAGCFTETPSLSLISQPYPSTFKDPVFIILAPVLFEILTRSPEHSFNNLNLLF